MISAQLLNGLHAGCTLVDELYKVVVALGRDSDAYLDLVAYGECLADGFPSSSRFTVMPAAADWILVTGCMN